MPRGDLEGLVDVVDGEGDAVHADLVGSGGLGLDRVGVDVLEELEATVAVRRLQHRDLGVVAVEADGGVGPLATDRVAADDRQPEVGEEGDRRFEVADGDADVLELDGHVSHATEPVRGRIREQKWVHRRFGTVRAQLGSSAERPVRGFSNGLRLRTLVMPEDEARIRGPRNEGFTPGDGQPGWRAPRPRLTAGARWEAAPASGSRDREMWRAARRPRQALGAAQRRACLRRRSQWGVTGRSAWRLQML